jgi:hypothetical protein
MIYFNRYTIWESIYFVAEGHWEIILRLTFCQFPPSCLASFPKWCLVCCFLPIRECHHSNNCPDRILWIQHLNHDTKVTLIFHFQAIKHELYLERDQIPQNHIAQANLYHPCPFSFFLIPQVKSKSPEILSNFSIMSPYYRSLTHLNCNWGEWMKWICS